jgi:TFIIH basal transcription factor complex TTD-A subunit
MPRATAGKPLSSLARDVYKLTSLQGTLVQCDPSIKAIISKINEENGGLYISEDIDDETCLINTKKLDELKQKLKDV